MYYPFFCTRAASINKSSIFFRTRQGGINRAIRENTTMLLLFKVNQACQIKKLYEEADVDMSEQQFIALCKEVHSIDYNFLLMDFAPKHPSMKFRSGWDTIIQPKMYTDEEADVEMTHVEDKEILA